MTDPRVELKACPFCNQAAGYVDLGSDHAPAYGMIVCNHCEASSGEGLRESVIERWNLRAALASPSRREEELSEKLEKAATEAIRDAVCVAGLDRGKPAQEQRGYLHEGLKTFWAELADIRALAAPKETT